MNETSSWRQGSISGSSFDKAIPQRSFRSIERTTHLRRSGFALSLTLVRGLREEFRRVDQDDRTVPLADLRLPAYSRAVDPR